MDEMINEIAEKQGWTTETIYDLLLTFVNDNGLTDKLVEFLQARADEENSESEG